MIKTSLNFVLLLLVGMPLFSCKEEPSCPDRYQMPSLKLMILDTLSNQLENINDSLIDISIGYHGIIHGKFIVPEYSIQSDSIIMLPNPCIFQINMSYKGEEIEELHLSPVETIAIDCVQYYEIGSIESKYGSDIFVSGDHYEITVKI